MLYYIIAIIVLIMAGLIWLLIINIQRKLERENNIKRMKRRLGISVFTPGEITFFPETDQIILLYIDRNPTLKDRPRYRAFNWTTTTRPSLRISVDRRALEGEMVKDLHLVFESWLKDHYPDVHYFNFLSITCVDPDVVL